MTSNIWHWLAGFLLAFLLASQLVGFANQGYLEVQYQQVQLQEVGVISDSGKVSILQSNPSDSTTFFTNLIRAISGWNFEVLNHGIGVWVRYILYAFQLAAAAYLGLVLLEHLPVIGRGSST